MVKSDGELAEDDEVRKQRAWLRPPSTGPVLEHLAESLNRSYLRASVLAMPMIAFFIALLWWQLDRTKLAAWCIGTSLAATFHIGLSVAHRRPGGDVTQRLKVRCIALLLSGVVWGALPFLRPRPGHERESQTIVALLMVTLVASNTLFSAQLRRIFFAYQLPLALCAAAGFASHRNSFSYLLAAFMIFCLFSTIVLHDQANRLVVGSVQVGYDNAALAADLTDQRRRLADTNTDLSAANRALEHRARHDELTGLANRSAFADRLETALTEARDGQVAVLFVDVDRFKVINDTHGHRFGDALLIEIAATISNCLDTGDLASRFGGDEFTVLLPNCRNVVHAMSVARRIRTAVAALREHELEASRVSVSIGVALAAPGTDSPASMMRSADIALYRAKQNGRNCVELFEESTTGPSTQAIDEVDEAVYEAFDRGEIRGWFQPEVDLETGEIRGAEALARWEHSDGVRSAGSFMHAVERHGLLDELTTAVAASVIQANRVFPDVPGFRTHLNVSAKFLHNPQRIEGFIQECERAGLDLGRIALEVTETAVIEDLPAAAAWLQQARDAGMTVFLDDFGMGYCSLGVFAQLPIDGLKIDMSFVRQLNTSVTSRAIVRATVQLADELGLHVIAEGVETIEQARTLRDLGVHHAQGFLYSGAVPGDVLADWLRNGAPWQRAEATSAAVF